MRPGLIEHHHDEVDSVVVDHRSDSALVSETDPGWLEQDPGEGGGQEQSAG